MIEAQGLSKIYSGTAAISDITLSVANGQSLGIVGTNGSGRTTLLRILATQLKPTSGQVQIDGIDALKHPFRARPKIGYVAQSQSFYDSMTVGEFLKFVAACQNEKLSQSSILAEQPFDGLAPEMSLRALSQGSRQKLALTAVLIHKPSLLILDEPLTHLDPIAAVQFGNLIKKFRSQGGTVLMACNRTADVPMLCDDVAFMHEGRILKICRSADLRRDITEMLMEMVTGSAGQHAMDTGKA